MIRVEGLSKNYGTVAAVRGVSFEVNQGEIVGFLGPNGAGKSTTMRIVTGFIPPTAGKAFVGGLDVEENPLAVKQRIGYLPESVPLYYEMLVRSFLRYAAEVKGIGRKQRDAEADRVMELCGLTEMAYRPIQHLSKGYRQRTGLAQALIGNPPVLILDEPTVGLDPKQIIDIREMIKGLATDHTVLLSTHILPEVQMICERVIIIHQGRIVAEDSMANLAGGSDEAIIQLSVTDKPNGLTETLEKIEGVTSVTPLGSDRYTIRAQRQPGVSETLARAVIESGAGLAGLHEVARTLEDVFVEAIATEEKAGA